MAKLTKEQKIARAERRAKIRFALEEKERMLVINKNIAHVGCGIWQGRSHKKVQPVCTIDSGTGFPSGNSNTAYRGGIRLLAPLKNDFMSPLKKN